MSKPKTIPFHCGDRKGEVKVRERGSLAYQLPIHEWSPLLIVPERLVLGHGARQVLERVYRGTLPPKSPLSTRGWVFQERILSPRTLHFGMAEVGWECRSLISCECSALSKRYKRTTSLLKKALTSMSWTKVVQVYTLLQLTFPTDRLVAISGLAEARPSTSSNKYCFGMWQNNFKHELLWRSFRSGNRLDIAPTW
jgi:hypothetical protein